MLPATRDAFSCSTCLTLRTLRVGPAAAPCALLLLLDFLFTKLPLSLLLFLQVLYFLLTLAFLLLAELVSALFLLSLFLQQLLLTSFPLLTYFFLLVSLFFEQLLLLFLFLAFQKFLLLLGFAFLAPDVFFPAVPSGTFVFRAVASVVSSFSRFSRSCCSLVLRSWS